MNTPFRQQGLSSLSWLVVIMVAVFFGLCAVKLLPAYMGAYTVDTAISNAVEKGDFNGLSVGRIRSKLSKHFDVNRIEGVAVGDIKISRKKGNTLIDSSYEQRIPLLYNIDVVLKFDSLTYEFPTRAGGE